MATTSESVPASTSDSAPAATRLRATKTMLGDLLWEVSTYIELMSDRELKQLEDLGLSLPTNGLLERIWRTPGITAAEVSRAIPKSQQAISQVAARLEKLGYIERRVGTGRSVGLYPTESGARAAELGARCEEEIEQRLRGLLGTERHAELVSLLTEARETLREAG